MANVTVLGTSSSQTITIPITTAGAAVVAQSLLNGITAGVLAGTFAQVNYTGSSTLPAQPTTPGAGIIEQGTASLPLAPFSMGSFNSAILNGAASQTVISGLVANETIVSGVAGAVVLNLAQNTNIVFGGGNNAVAQASSLLGLAPSAVINLDANLSMDGSSGASTINSYAAGDTINLINTGNGTNTVNFTSTIAGGLADNLFLSGNSTVAATVNAAGNPLVISQNGSNGLIHAGTSNVTLFGGGATGGTVTLFGGSGNDLVNGGIGAFTAGTAGSSLIVAGSTGKTTITGGAAGDTLIGGNSSSVLIAGTGSETLSGGASNGGIIAFGYQTPTNAAGNAVVTMLGSTTGGNLFEFGKGITAITGQHQAVGGQGNTFIDGFGGTGAQVVVGDFRPLGVPTAANPIGSPVAGSDLISSINPAGGTFQLNLSVGSNPGSGQMSFTYAISTVFPGKIDTTVFFGDGTRMTLFGTQLEIGNIQ